MTSIDAGTGSYVSVDGLEVSLGDGVLSLTLNRPDSLNSLTATMLNGVADALDKAAADPQVKVVRLAGAGRGFSSGAGISADDQSKKAGGLTVLDAANRAVRSIVACPRPVVSVVQGPAAGVGASLALACDIVHRFGQGLFHARLHQDRPDARRWRFGSRRCGRRPDPCDADGTARGQDPRRRGIPGGPGDRCLPGRRAGRATWTR